MNTLFKRTALCAFIGSLATGCMESGDGDNAGDRTGAGNGADFLATGAIERVGDVDWYEFTTTEDNQELAIKVQSKTVRPDIELLATVYKEDESGNKVRLYADHSTEGSVKTPEVDIALVIDEPQTIHIAVRDLRDDEADGYDYLLSIDAAAGADRSSSFADAISLNESCQKDVIGSRDDVDTFSFNVSEAGVYRFITEYEKKDADSPDLIVKLFAENGALISQTKDAAIGGKTFAMVQYLQTGTYYMVAEDYGHDQFDTYSPFTVCASASQSTEAGKNDDLESATAITLGSVIEGSLDYDLDQDWYQVPVQVSGNGDVNILYLEFDTTTAHDAYRYDVKVVDASGNALFTHSHNAVSGGFNTELKVESDGPYYLVVTPVGDAVYTESDKGDVITNADYSAIINTQTVTDIGERDGNDAIDEFYSLSNGETVNAKISYRGDLDWYGLTVPSNEDVIVEVFLETENQNSGGDVDYSLAVFDSDVIRILDDELGGDAPTKLKTSFFMAARDDAQPNTLKFRVKDILDNDANAQSGYRLQANIVAIPTALDGQGEFSGARYVSESAEQSLKRSRDEDTVILENSDPNFDRTFADDRTLLVFDGESSHEQFTRQTDAETGVVTFTSGWMGGYVDYQGDQDFYKFNLSALIPTEQQTDDEGALLFDEDNNPVMVDADSTWYYEIKVELVADATDVEYAWKIHKDLDGNQKVNNYSGIWSTNADRTYANEAINLTSGADGSIWGNQKEYEGTYYFKVGDYNMAGSNMNLYQDYDWGYTAPYYFRFTLTYYPNLERAQAAE